MPPDPSPSPAAEPSGPRDSTDLRLRRRIRTKEQVQAQALALFVSQGYEQTSVEDIAHAAAISPRTFYRYFACKEDVVLWDAYDELPPEQLWDAHPGEAPFSVMIRRIRELTEQLNVQDHDVFLLRAQLSYRVPEIRARFVNRIWDLLQPHYDQFLRTPGQSGDDLSVAVPFAAAFTAMLVAVERWQRHDGTEDLPRLIDEALSALGALTPPE